MLEDGFQNDCSKTTSTQYVITVVPHVTACMIARYLLSVLVGLPAILTDISVVFLTFQMNVRIGNEVD
jgi:hypothetical protein